MTRQAVTTRRRPGRHRAVQPGDRHRRPRLLLRPDRARSRHRRARRGRRGPGRAGAAQPRGGARRGRRDVRGRGQDDDLPDRHRRLRGVQRGLRPVRARSAARPLDVRGRRASRRARWSRSRRSRGDQIRASGPRTCLTPPAGRPYHPATDQMTPDARAPGPERRGGEGLPDIRSRAPPYVTPAPSDPTRRPLPSSWRPASARG